MYIKGLVIEGFKCYRDKLVPDFFTPRHNVVGEPPRPSL